MPRRAKHQTIRTTGVTPHPAPVQYVSQRMAAPLTGATQLTGGGGFCRGQCFYDMPIAVDPNDANVVYIGGQTSSNCGRLVGKSTDGGASFAADSNGLHADDHSLFFDGAGNIYTGKRRRRVEEVGERAAGTAWTNLNNAPFNTLQFESIAVHPTDRNLMIGGTQDNGTEASKSAPGNWSSAEGGDGGYALIDQSATDTTNVTMYHTFFNQTGTQIGFDRAVHTTCLSHNRISGQRGASAFVTAESMINPFASMRRHRNRYILNGGSTAVNRQCSASMRRWPWGRARRTRSISEPIGCIDPRIEATT